jgi:hypothetical protein
MPDWLKKSTASALVAALIALSPGTSAAQEVAAAARGVSALPASVSVPLGAPVLSAPLAASLPGLNPVLQVSALPLAALPNLAAASVGARGPEEASAAPAAAAPASAPAAVPAAASPEAARTAGPSGGFSRLASAAAATLGFWKPGVSNVALKVRAGRDFDQSAAPSSLESEPVAGAAFSSPRVHGSGLLKPGPRRWIVAGALAAALAVHPSPAAAALSKISAPSYYFANVAGSIFPLMQIYRIFQRRSADVSSATLLTGAASSLLLTVNFAYLGKAVAAVQNLSGILCFGFIAAQKYWYARRPAPAGTPPASFAAAAAKTALGAAALAGASLALGKVLLAAAPAAALLGTCLVPFQVLAGLGFAYLMLPAYLKIQREKSVGDSSRWMAATYFACIVASGIWGLNQLVGLSSAPAGESVLPLAAFAGAAVPLSLALVRWIGSRTWPFIPDGVKLGKWTIGRESLVNVASFLVLAAFMLVTAGLGALAFAHLLAVPPESLRKFVVYLFYVTGNIVGAAVTSETLRAFREQAPKKG